ncbi:hypothetical protein CLU92_5478 [Janthinobacterium sp. 61]|uniref:hypothetical protein n=1 Tax=Janthinobacterium sp. 61 TaxID=2035209 RepID=UPI000C70ED6F|nr:hypothetical protein [Janthinobacterium sp. 61]PKV42739.1 hypothetical protein CLU92_0009 [Janthinobacterium sp. 61]PKV48003.1 hypothetical protein CLU92_5478 [Janthinobacterium sp. 61]
MSMLTLNWLAGIVLLAHSLCVLNRMHRRSNHLYRLFYVLLGVGAVAVLTGPLYGYTQPPTGEVLLNAGMAGVVMIGWFAKNRRAVP